MKQASKYMSEQASKQASKQARASKFNTWNWTKRRRKALFGWVSGVQRKQASKQANQPTNQPTTQPSN